MKDSDLNDNYRFLKEKYERHEKILIQAYKELKDKELKLQSLNEDLKLNEKKLKDSNEELTTTLDNINAKNRIIENQNEELRITLHQLKETQAQLLQAEKMASLGVLTAGVAHEINNPLNFIMGAYEGIQDYYSDSKDAMPESISLYLNGLIEGIERISKIVSGLNQFSRDSKSNDEDCDIQSIIDDCLVMLNNELIDHIIEKKYCTTNCIIKGNIGQLHQVFLNILQNAIHATNKIGTIKIETFKENKYLIISITDNGYGVDTENLKKLMDPFFTTKDPGKGTGLGLSIVYNILKDHKGTIEIFSEKSTNTVVKVSLPCWESN
ncbi:ATP-binding protein [Labilibaculum sp.]|uniref:sensor histidine kinase n=1 Tax=Labilibaculum sp. TaxID=2060723 RepID=UPI0035660478